VAYRKLFGLAVVSLGLTLGCGGGEGRTAVDVPEDSDAPPSDTQPPFSSDRPPTNSDQPPVNPDQPSVNPDQPGGAVADLGQLEELCHDVCDAVEQCQTEGQNPDVGMNVDRVCDSGCQIPASTQVSSIPCLNELTAAFDCLAGAGVFCLMEEDAAQVEACKPLAQQYSACIEVTEPVDPDPPGNCTQDGGCENCGSECATCFCEAGTDPDAFAECAQECPTP
jgi:hypothetical protein